MRFLLLVVIGFACSGINRVCAQGHEHHHAGSESDQESDSVSTRKMWDAVDADLRREFDSTYTAMRSGSKPLDQIFAEYLDRIPAKAMLEFLDSNFPYCHSLAHDLGVAVYRHFRSLGEAVQECGDGCSSACMHGAVREAFGNATVNDIVASVDSVCAIGGMQEINSPGNCAHALGHALMMATGDSLSQSLEGCSQFPGLSLPHYCATGVFMEYGADKSFRDRPPTGRETVSRYPCDEFPEFAAACYRYVVSRMRRSMHAPHAATLAAECRKLPEKEQLGCFRGLGVAFAASVDANPETVNSVCSDPNRNNVLVCIDALVEQSSYLRGAKAEPICDQLKGDAHDVCTAALTGRYQLYKPIMDVYLGASN